VASTSHPNGDVKDPKDKGSKARNLRQLKNSDSKLRDSWFV